MPNARDESELDGDVGGEMGRFNDGGAQYKECPLFLATYPTSIMIYHSLVDMSGYYYTRQVRLR